MTQQHGTTGRPPTAADVHGGTSGPQGDPLLSSGVPSSGVPRSRARSRAARFAVASTALLAAGVLLTGCGDPEGSGDAAPRKVSGGAAPAGGDAGEASAKPSGSKDGGSGTDGSGTEAGGGSASGSSESGASATPSSGTAGGSGDDGGGSGAGGPAACTTGDLRASVGPNHPGAGQQNFSLVLTNRSGKTCTVRGYPGMAFLDGAGEQVSFDPHRMGGARTTVRLAPGNSAWAPLTWSNPEMTGVTTVTPATVEITPPNQTTSLKVPWNDTPVTNTGKASVPKIGPLAPGSGA